MANGLKATYRDTKKKKVLAFYIKRTGLLKRTPGISKAIADLKVDKDVKDFIVVYDEDEIMVIVDINNRREDPAAFGDLVDKIERLICKNGDSYRAVEYPTDSKYDPRMIYDDKNYGGFDVAKKRTWEIFRP